MTIANTPEVREISFIIPTQLLIILNTSPCCQWITISSIHERFNETSGFVGNGGFWLFCPTARSNVFRKPLREVLKQPIGLDYHVERLFLIVDSS